MAIAQQFHKTNLGIIIINYSEFNVKADGHPEYYPGGDFQVPGWGR